MSEKTDEISRVTEILILYPPIKFLRMFACPSIFFRKNISNCRKCCNLMNSPFLLPTHLYTTTRNYFKLFSLNFASKRNLQLEQKNKSHQKLALWIFFNKDCDTSNKSNICVFKITFLFSRLMSFAKHWHCG